MELPTFIACILGLALDFFFGDPRKMPHIVKLTGRLIPILENAWVCLTGRNVLSGAGLWLSLNGLMLGSYFLIRTSLHHFNPWFTVPLDAVVVFQSMAFTDLIKHIRAITDALGVSLEKARERVSWIVGRDTSPMDESAICRAVIESGSENYNDGAIAPLFWLLLLGPVGILFFRICNTLDAMTGHRNERFEKVGKASARIDDVLNFIPARLCSMILYGRWNLKAWWRLRTDAKKHPSWNAGWPEAAMARRLGIVIGGEMYVNGVLLHTETMNSGAPQPTAGKVLRSIEIMQKTYACSLIFAVSILTLKLVV